MNLELILKDIGDEYTRENFSRLVEFLKKDALRIPEWKFFTITFTEGKTGFRYRHGLGYLPKDIIHLSTTDNENVVFKYDDFDETYFYFDVSGACTVRFFAGTYREN